MKDNLSLSIILIGAVYFLIAFIAIAFLSFPFYLAGVFIGFMAAFLQFWIFASANRAWVRFIIPSIPVIFFTLAIVEGINYVKPEPVFIPLDFGPWFALVILFSLFSLAALFPAAMNVMVSNKTADKVYLIAVYSFCIWIALFVSAPTDTIFYIPFITYVVLLAMTSFIYPCLKNRRNRN